MTAPGKRGAAPAGAASNAAFKGALLVGLAVLIGTLLLLKSFDDGGGGSPVVAGGTSTTSTPATGGGTTAPVTTAHDPSQVKVLVLNGVDPKKAIAKPAADALKAANFTTLSPSDAKTTVPASVVYFQPGYQLDAQAVASRLGIPSAAVIALPNPLPPTVADAKDANVIAVIGPDSPIAGGTTTVPAN